MNQAMKNKEFILHYYNTLSGAIKTPEMLRQFTDDPILIDTITFLTSSSVTVFWPFNFYRRTIKNPRTRAIGLDTSYLGQTVHGFSNLTLVV